MIVRLIQLTLSLSSDVAICERTFTTMGTEASLQRVGDDCEQGLAIVETVFAAVTAKMSPWVKDSDLNRLNAAGGRFVTIDPSTSAVGSTAWSSLARTSIWSSSTMERSSLPARRRIVIVPKSRIEDVYGM